METGDRCWRLFVTGIATVAAVQDYAERLHTRTRPSRSSTGPSAKSADFSGPIASCGRDQDSIDLASTGSKFDPPEWVDAETQFSDQLFFLVVALRQVLRGRGLMEHFGFEMPSIRQAALIQSWRNVEEHSDIQPREHPSARWRPGGWSRTRWSPA